MSCEKYLREKMTVIRARQDRIFNILANSAAPLTLAEIFEPLHKEMSIHEFRSAIKRLKVTKRIQTHLAFHTVHTKYSVPEEQT